MQSPIGDEGQTDHKHTGLSGLAKHLRPINIASFDKAISTDSDKDHIRSSKILSTKFQTLARYSKQEIMITHPA